MQQKIRLTSEQEAILERLTNEQLHDLVEFKESKAFITFKEVINLLVDYEKNLFFSIQEVKMPSENFKAMHAESRGRIGGITSLLYMSAGAKLVLERREEKRKEKQNA